ncbi:MAG: cache domain-containing protein [Thermomicrobiales bacterium]
MTRHWSLRTRFVLFATACLIPLVMVVVFFLDRGIQRNTEQIVNSETTISNLTSQVMSGYLNGVVSTLGNLATQQEIVAFADPNTDTTRVLALTRNARTDLAGLLIFDDKGALVSTSGPAPTTLVDAIQGQLSQTIETGQPVISHPISDTEDRTVLVITVPITTMSAQGSATTAATGAGTPTPTITPTPQSGSSETAQGKNLGAIAAVVNVSYLESLVVPYARGKTEIAVVSKEGVIVGTSGIAKNVSYFLGNQADHIDQALEGDSGNFTTTDANGDERLGVFAPIQSDVTNWAVIVTSPAPGTYSRSLVIQSLVALLLAGIVILTLAVIFGEYTARQLRILADRANAMKRGVFSVNNEPIGGGEVRQLSIALADMGDQLATQVHGLEQSQVERSHQAEQMRNLLRRTLRLQEDERRRIAGDIHDAVSPLITGALYQARALQMRNGSSPAEEREETLASVNSLLEQASNEIHSVIFDLRPPDLDDIGVVAAIEAFIQSFSRTGLSLQLEVVNDLPPQTPEVRLGIYRIVQEALHNVVRHASADEAVVRLESTNGILRVTIKDNGIGFDPVTSLRPTSLGLLSMRERAAAIGATFKIVSKPGDGSAIVIERTETGDMLSEVVISELIDVANADDTEPAASAEKQTQPDTQERASS